MQPRREPKPLLGNLTFGIGNSDHQCEAYEPRFQDDIQDVWERLRNLKPRGQATDFWNRYPEDLRLARDIGCRAFRFSISWARVEPSPGQFDQEVLAHYRQLAEDAVALGLEPIVTLHHFSWPTFIDMLSEDFPSAFARYVDKVVSHLGDLASTYVTINEPNALVYGYIKPWWERSYHLPPGLPPEATPVDEMRAVGRLMRNLFLAHTAARTVIKQALPNARVGSNAAILGLPIWLQNIIDRTVTRLRDPDDLAAQGHLFAERRFLEQGQADVVIATLTVTRDRADEVTFSEVYFLAGQALLVKAESTIQSPDDLVGKTLAVVTSSASELAVAKLLPRSRSRSFPDYAAARVALDASQADAILTDDTILLGIMRQHPGRYRLVGPRLTSDERYAAAVTHGNPELLAAVNLAISSFKESGAWEASFARHFPGSQIPPVPESTVPAHMADRSGFIQPNRFSKAGSTEQAGGQLPRARKGTLLRRIQDRGSIRIVVKEDLPGFGFRDPQTGELSGLEIDLAREISRRVFGDPNRVVFHPATTKERLPLLRSFVRFLDPVLRLWGILSTSLSTNWWYLGMAGKLPPFLCPPECVGQLDFVGMDYYWGINSLQLGQVRKLLDAFASGRYDEAPVYPAALYQWLKHLSDMFPGKAVMVVENGSVVRSDSWPRPAYIRQHVEQVRRARRDGVNVTGYLCWSITTNREWGSTPTAEGSDFGLYQVDLDHDPTLQRKPTDSVQAYREIIERGG